MSNPDHNRFPNTSLNDLLEEVIFVVCSLQFEREVQATICKCFTIDDECFLKIKDEAQRNRKPLQVEVNVDSIRAKNLLPSRIDGSIHCTVKADDEPTFFTHKSYGKPSPHWITHFQHSIKNFSSEKLDIEVWHELETNATENSFILRSIDTLSKRVKAGLRPSTSSPGKYESEKILQSNPIKECYDEDGMPDFVSRRASVRSPENNWMVNAFATLRKHKTTNFAAFRRSFLDINSTIPLGPSSLHDGHDVPQEAVESKLDITKPEKPAQQHKEVKVKPEVNVKRQLFSFSEKQQLDSSDSNDFPGFSIIPLRENSQNNAKKASFGSSSLRMPRKLSEKLENLKKSPSLGNQFLQKRMSMSDIDKSTEAWRESEHQKNFSKSKFEVLNNFSPIKSLPPLGLNEKLMLCLFKANNKDSIGSASITIKNSFFKMNCCRWTIAENANLQSTSPKTLAGNDLTKPESIMISFNLQVETLDTHLLPAAYLSDLLMLFCTHELEIHTEKIKDHENGIFLPISTNSKIILKSLIFIHNICEAKLNLAIWSVLASDALIKKIHPKFLFYWLTKIEASVSCSSSLIYTKIERDTLAKSISNFIILLCNKFSRFHASFAVNHTSELIYSLRSVHLLTESKSLHNIIEEADIFIASSWPKSAVLDALHAHAGNWVSALMKEVPSEIPLSRECLSLCTHDSLRASLASAIRRGEQAFLSINDFLVLGEKVYEPVFKSELDESYINIIWETLGNVVIKYLEPILPVAECFQDRSLDFLEMQDFHVSIWIIVLHLSKLLRFQSKLKSVEILEYELPSIFHKTFSLLVQLWVDISFSRADKAMKLELDMDTLIIERESCFNDNIVVTSSAVEFVDIITIFQERISRLHFPGGRDAGEAIVSHIHDQVTSLLKMYQIKICKLALERSFNRDTLSTQVCLAINNIKRSVMEADKLLSKISKNENAKNSKYSIEDVTSDGADFLFSKAFPRISSRFRNIFMNCCKEQLEYNHNWVINLLEPSLGDASMYAITLQYFWCFLFSILKMELNSFRKPEEYKNMGDFLDNLHYFFQATLGVNLFEYSEIEYQQLILKIELKSCSTTELIRNYYAQRYAEQNGRTDVENALVVNIHFLKGKGLVADIHMGPFICQNNRNRRRSSWSFSKFTEVLPLDSTNMVVDESKNNKPKLVLENADVIAEKKTIVRATSHKILKLVAFSKVTEFYVKVKLQPSEWFKGTTERKSKKDTRNPPVFDSQLNFKQIEADSEGTRRGGFIIFSLKSTNSNISHSIGEAIFPLKETPFVSSGERWKVKHSYLIISKPTKIEDYPALLELSTRKHDKEALSFISKLENGFLIT